MTFKSVLFYFILFCRENRFVHVNRSFSRRFTSNVNHFSLKHKNNQNIFECRLLHLLKYFADMILSGDFCLACIQRLKISSPLQQVKSEEKKGFRIRIRKTESSFDNGVWLQYACCHSPSLELPSIPVGFTYFKSSSSSMSKHISENTMEMQQS